MKKNQILALVMFVSALFLSSCKKDKTLNALSTLESSQNVSSTELKDFFTTNLKDQEQNFIIDADNPPLITGENGSTIEFFANSFMDASGNIVNGDIDITLVEIMDKSDMVLANKATLAYGINSDLAPLVSGGELKVTAKQNGNVLKLRPGYPYKMTVPAPNGTTPDMSLFYGINTNDTLIWDLADSTSFLSQLNGTAYTGYIDSLNWINCDYFYNNPNPQTFVEVDLPSGFTNNNCVIYISFDNLNAITTFHNYSNETYTTAPGYRLPIGLEVHFIALSIINGSPNVAIIPSTIVDNHHETIPSLTATTTSQFAADLSNLP